MKTFFTALGWREVTNWHCLECNNFWTGGADIMVEESRKAHEAVCPARKPLKITGGSPHGFGIILPDGTFHRVDLGSLGDLIVKAQEKDPRVKDYARILLQHAERELASAPGPSLEHYYTGRKHVLGELLVQWDKL